MSFILNSLVKKRLPEWGLHVYTEDEAYEITRKDKVRVVEAEIRSRGEYLIYQSVAFIILKQNLARNWRVWVLWHEIAHHWLHHPGNYKFHKGVIGKLDFEANFVAAISMIPAYLLETQTLDEIIAEYNYPKEIKPVREFIREYYRM